MSRPTKTPSLPPTVIGIDVETTSLDPATGDIIEVAAIRFDTKTGRPLDRYVHLCRPTKPITQEITAITHITNEMVAQTAPFADHVEKLKKFIGQDTIFAHNAPFDINYLAYHGLKLPNHIWDTFPLAGIAWPTAASYNLGMLTNSFIDPADVSPAIQSPPSKKPQQSTNRQEHRAGDDVLMTWHLLQAIISRLAAPADIYEKIKHILSSSDQTHYLPLFSIQPASPKSTSQSAKTATAQPDKTIAANISLTSQGNKALKSLLGPKGALTQSIPRFSYRPQQLAMAQEVFRILNNHEIGLIEAGTGTGKTYGYLIPLLLHLINQPDAAKHSYTISTHTKHLQDQLYHKDLPRLLSVLQLTDVSVAILKGRRNYLCTARLAQSITRSSINSAEAMILIKILIWHHHDGSGDLERLNLSHQASKYLYHLHADSLSCRRGCPTNNPTCPYHVARQKAQQADIIIINHSLLTQLSTEDIILSNTNLIIDEAHHLEASSREATRHDLSDHQLAEIIAPFAQIAKHSPANKERILAEAQSVIDEYQAWLALVTQFMSGHAPTNTVHLTPAVRRSTSWSKIADAGMKWRSRLQFLIGLTQGITTKSSSKIDTNEVINDAETFSRYFESFILGDEERIQWIELESNYQRPSAPKIILNDVALSVRPQLKALFGTTSSTTLTSATLTIGGKFDYIKRRIGINDAKEIILDTPFDYRRQMLIYIVDDAPPPYNHSYHRYIARQISRTAQLTSGRLLGLFTSHKSVKETYQRTLKGLNKANIKLLAQLLTGGRHNMIKHFKETPATVLLGTYSFWEGIDIPGESLSSVVIAKLPFPSPHDPVIDAIAEQEEFHPFINLSIPLMILRLRQGIGRLIRTRDDRGAIIILDSRFLQQSYGQTVLDSLPPATINIGSTKELIPTLTDWFGQKKIDQWHQALSDK